MGKWDPAIFASTENGLRQWVVSSIIIRRSWNTDISKGQACSSVNSRISGAATRHNLDLAAELSPKPEARGDTLARESDAEKNI